MRPSPLERRGFGSHMALGMHCSLVGRGLASSSPGRRIKPLSASSICQKVSRSKDGSPGCRDPDVRHLSCGQVKRLAWCGRWPEGEGGGGGGGGGGEQGAEWLRARVQCEDLEGSGGAGSGSRMAGVVESLRSIWVGGDLCSESGGLWRKVSAALLCSCAVVTPGMGSPVAAVEAVPASDFVAALVTLGGALGILQFFDELAKRDLLEKKLSRKLCHILSGLVFMLFWPFFSSAPLAKYMAAFAPFANGVRMIGLGLGLWRNEALVKAISREGGQRELLHGPLYYAITITIATLCFWRNSPVGACAVATLCAGDGFADIMGRKYGTRKLPYNSSKSYIGSVAFFVFASLASMGYVAYFATFGFFTATAKMYLATLGVALASAVAESLPLPLDDNFTVPFTAIGVGMLLLPY